MIEEHHIERIFKAYKEDKVVEGFAKVIPNKQIRDNGATLSISQCVCKLTIKDNTFKVPFGELLQQWEQNRKQLRESLETIIKQV